jgi:hypothetical protein
MTSIRSSERMPKLPAFEWNPIIWKYTITCTHGTAEICIFALVDCHLTDWESFLRCWRIGKDFWIDRLSCCDPLDKRMMKILYPIRIEEFLENSWENRENTLSIDSEKEAHFQIMKGIHWPLEIAQRLEICLDEAHERSSPAVPDAVFAWDSLSFFGVKQARSRKSFDPSRRYF